MKRFSVLAISILFSTLVSAKAQTFVESPPLAKTINTPVGEIRQTPQTRVPIITWGGDIATIYANGNSDTTQPNSIFAQQGLKLKLVREDDFDKQLSQYLSGDTPYLRGTMGMINMASELTTRDTRTKPVVIYQHTWSSGGDQLVVRGNIKSAKDLRGKTVALQVYGPHVDYLAKILKDAGLKLSDVKIKWTNDLTGTKDIPIEGLRSGSIDAAFAITPDALAATSNGTVGTGAEGSIKGARVLLSTKTANTVIADVYVVRSDYLQSNKTDVQKFVHGLMLGEEKLYDIMHTKSSEYKATVAASAKILLDSAQATDDLQGLYEDCAYVGYAGNVKFFTDTAYPRNFPKLTTEIQQALVGIGLLSKVVGLEQAKWNYNNLKNGITETEAPEMPKFNPAAVQQIAQRRAGTGEGELFTLTIHFAPNQNDFNDKDYAAEFAKIIDLSATYGGAIITVEGHSDPLGYLQKQSQGAQDVILRQMAQAGKNLSVSRAMAVRDSIIAYAKKRGVNLDSSQFATVGFGYDKPVHNPPQNEQEWKDNMRVEFHIVNIEAEPTAFRPLGK